MAHVSIASSSEFYAEPVFRYPKADKNPHCAHMAPEVKALYDTLVDFVADECIPAEKVYLQQLAAQTTPFSGVPPVMEELKAKARARGLWNLFLPKPYTQGRGLSNRDYATLCEVSGSAFLAPEAINCAAPDTGNMEVLAKYGTPEQQAKWLEPLLDGRIRSAFLMTEPDVASSDATTIHTTIRADGDSYVINGRKWWSSGAMDPRCKVYILMGKTNTEADIHHQQSMIIVPADAPGIKIVRALSVFGYLDAPHGHAEVVLTNVRVPKSNMLLGEGRGFEIAQGRLGPGRIHHCMRAVGLGERALALMTHRAISRVAFGKPLALQATMQRDIANSRIEIEAARLLVLHCASLIDAYGIKGARREVAIIKVFVPRTIVTVIDRSIQAHGGCGVSQDTFLPYAFAGMRSLRIADGPDDVHERTVGLMELKTAEQRAKL